MSRGWVLTVAACAALSLAPDPAAAERFRMQADTGGYTLEVTSWRGLPFRTVIRQRYDFSCGSAALATLLTYHYGRTTDEAHVFAAMYSAGDQSLIRARGFSLLDMQRHVQSLRLQADGYRVSLAQLERSGAPAIAMIEVNGYRHFVVIKGIRGDRVLVGDPAAGLMIYRRADFERYWNGVAFIIHGESVQGAFNLQTEWEARPRAPLTGDFGDYPIEPLTRELPPLYQITDVTRLEQ
jgi:predicted double-glycine peptidase